MLPPTETLSFQSSVVRLLENEMRDEADVLRRSPVKLPLRLTRKTHEFQRSRTAAVVSDPAAAAFDCFRGWCFAHSRASAHGSVL
jgi:hypothetical protein